MKQWWRNIQRAHRDEIRMHLGALTALMHVQENGVLMKPLIEFSNPTKSVFKFVDSEMTSIIEEVTSFTKLPFAGRRPVLLVIFLDHMFLYALGLKDSQHSRSVEDGWISLD